MYSVSLVDGIQQACHARDAAQHLLEDASLLLDILLVTSVAFLGGAIAHVLRMPTIVGFLVAGILIGPGTPGPVGDIENVARAADIGVILLMFGIGIQFSFHQLASYRRLILMGGSLQVVATILVGFAVGRLLGLASDDSLLTGFFLVSTSTVVAVKVLEERGQLQTVHGAVAINLSIFQDLTAVLLIIILPSLSGGEFHPFDVVAGTGKGVLLIAVTYLLSTRVLPFVWRYVAYARSRELSMLAAISLAVGFAAGSGLLGLSLAFGAFLAGLAISENRYGHQTLADVIPLRDVFASIFFVAMGMLVQPAIAWQEAQTVVAVVLLLVVGKSIVSTFAVRLAGLALVPAILTGLLLAQVGEFSFVIARAGLDAGIITSDLASALLVAAIISIVLNPMLVRCAPLLLEVAGRLPLLNTLLSGPVEVSNVEEVGRLRRHVVICGYGDAAASLVRTLYGRNLAFVVIDSDPFVFEAVRRADPAMPFIYGDATRPEILELAHVATARILAVTFSGVLETQITVLNARGMNRTLDVVARGTADSQSILREAGATEVVDAQFEASLEFIRHILHRYGIDGRQIAALQGRRRTEHYA